MKVKIKAMIKALFFFFISLTLLVTSSLAQSVQTVTDISGTDLGNPVIVDLLVIPTDGDATILFDILEGRSTGYSEGSAHQIYIPFRTDNDVSLGNIKNDQFSYYSNSGQLPRIDNSQPVEFSVSLRFRLNINITEILDHLHVAIKGDDGSGGFKVLKFLGEITGDTSLSLQTISIKNLCTLTGELDCSSLDKDVAPSSSSKSATLHFFLAERELNEDEDYTPTADNGVFYTINMSTKVFDDRIIDLNDLRKGDSQLIADYNGFTMSEIRSIYALTTNKGLGQCSGVVDSLTLTETMQSLGKTVNDLTNLETLKVLGQVKIEGLENSSCYEVRLFQCNLYGFCSYASQSLQNTPEAIEALLKKQACFFFTAGFGREHFVVDFFQEWRNEFLKKFWLGRTFIQWYYETAPQYTPYILKTPWLQEVIQFTGYLLYGVIKGWWLLSLLVALAIVHFCRRKRILSRQS